MLKLLQVSSFSSVDTAILLVFIFLSMRCTLYYATLYTFAAIYSKTCYYLIHSHHELNDVWFFLFHYYIIKMINISCILVRHFPLGSIGFSTVFSAAIHMVFQCCEYVYKSYLKSENCR